MSTLFRFVSEQEIYEFLLNFFNTDTETLDMYLENIESIVDAYSTEIVIITVIVVTVVFMGFTKILSKFFYYLYSVRNH